MRRCVVALTAALLACGGASTPTRPSPALGSSGAAISEDAADQAATLTLLLSPTGTICHILAPEGDTEALLAAIGPTPPAKPRCSTTTKSP